MSKPNIVLNFGIQLDGSEPQFKIYDDSAATWYEYTIPAGKYFYLHSDSYKNILNVLNVLCTGFITWSRKNDRQLHLDMAASADKLRLIKTDNDDYIKLAHMLGFYDNSGNVDYYTQVSASDGHVTQVTLTTWYTACGRTYETATERGFPQFAGIYAEAQSGETAAISTGYRSIVKDMQFTSIASDHVRDNDWYGSQTVLGTTENTDWTTSIWMASRPDLHLPVFYASIPAWNGADRKGDWWIRAPLDETCKQRVTGTTSAFDLTMSVSFVPVDEQDKFLYFASGLSAYALLNDSSIASTGDLFIIMDLYITGHDSNGFIFLNSTTSGTNINYGMRFNGTGQYLQWLQGISSYDILYTGLILANNVTNRLVVVRVGATGTNNVNLYYNRSLYTCSATKALSANDRLYLMDNPAVGAYNSFGYVKKFMMRPSLPTSTELSNALLGIDPDPASMTAVYKCNEQGGNYLLDSSGNDLTMTTANTSWAVIP